MVSIVPFLFGKPVPRYVSIAAAIALAAFVYSAIVPARPPVLSSDRLVLMVLFMKEAFYGLVVGMAVSVVFYAFSAVGQMVDNQRGTSIARLLIPQLNEQSSVSGIFLFQFGVVIYISLGGHLLFFDAFLQSFKTLPVLDFPAVGAGFFPMMDLFMKITGEVIYISLQMCAPVIIAIFLADIILGIANRVAPQINVWELGFHIKGYVGILMLFVSITMIGEQIYYYSLKSNAYSMQAVELLQGKIPPGLDVQPEPGKGEPSPEDGTPDVKPISP